MSTASDLEDAPWVGPPAQTTAMAAPGARTLARAAVIAPMIPLPITARSTTPPDAVLNFPTRPREQWPPVRKR